MNWTNRVDENFFVWRRKRYKKRSKIPKTHWCFYEMSTIAMIAIIKWIIYRYENRPDLSNWNEFEVNEFIKNGISPPKHVLYIYMHAVSNGLQLFMWMNIKKKECKCTFRKFVCSMLMPPEVTCFIENKFRFEFY